MVWFGKHSVAYVVYVPAALAGLLLPYAGVFTRSVAERTAASAFSNALASHGFKLVQATVIGQTNGHQTNGDLANGSASPVGITTCAAARLHRLRLPQALLGELLY